MLSFILRSSYFLGLVLIIISIIGIIFNTFLSGYYAEILSVLKPAMNSVVPYVVDYNTALFLTESILILLSIRFLVFLYKLLS